MPGIDPLADKLGCADLEFDIAVPGPVPARLVLVFKPLLESVPILLLLLLLGIAPVPELIEPVPERILETVPLSTGPVPGRIVDPLAEINGLVPERLAEPVPGRITEPVPLGID